VRMRSSRISYVCASAAAGSLKSAHAQQQDLYVCACAAAGRSQKSAHAQQCLRRLRMRNSISEVSACEAAKVMRMRTGICQQPAHAYLDSYIIHPVTNALTLFFDAIRQDTSTDTVYIGRDSILNLIIFLCCTK
jgi:hypothetical protein